MEPLIIISGDGHVGARPEDYRDYIDPQFRGALDDLVAENDAFLKITAARPLVMAAGGANPSSDEFAGWNVQTRLADLDADGVTMEVLHGGHQGSVLPFYSVMNKPYPADLRAAGARAHHRWVADLISQSDGRMHGVADPGPCLDMDATIAELTWCKQNGFVSVSLPQNTWDDTLPSVQDAYYEPIWSACEDLGLVLSVHAGWGSPQGKFWEFAEQFEKLVVGAADSTEASEKMLEAMAKSDDSPLALDMGPRRVLWQLMLGGVFDRHPGLKLVLTEVRADWLPSTIRLLDERLATGSSPMKLKPSEYWQQNCFATPSSIHESEIETRHDIGIDQMIFGTDYPHPESTWPQTREWIQHTFQGVPESDARKILGENALRCYGFDRKKVEQIAARIGPAPSDVLGSFDIPKELLDSFDQRAGLRRVAEQADRDAVFALLDEDMRLAASAR
jgi:predicted TIM-barrel fold metal-dependent hydrolase